MSIKEWLMRKWDLLMLFIGLEKLAFCTRANASGTELVHLSLAISARGYPLPIELEKIRKEAAIFNKWKYPSTPAFRDQLLTELEEMIPEQMSRQEMAAFLRNDSDTIQ